VDCHSSEGSATTLFLLDCKQTPHLVKSKPASEPMPLVNAWYSISRLSCGRPTFCQGSKHLRCRAEVIPAGRNQRRRHAMLKTPVLALDINAHLYVGTEKAASGMEHIASFSGRSLQVDQKVSNSEKQSLLFSLSPASELHESGTSTISRLEVHPRWGFSRFDLTLVTETPRAKANGRLSSVTE
jgi:hypothetical protein